MSIRSAMIHGTGYTAGDLIDEAVAAAGGGSPKPGEPTRFLTLTYHHPGNEDGTSVSATTGIPIPNSAIAENTFWRLDWQTKAVSSSNTADVALDWQDSFQWGFRTVMRRTGDIAYADGVTGNSTYPEGSIITATPFFIYDGQVGYHFAVKNNQIYAIIHGMSTNTPTDWTINVQLTPIAP